LIPTKLIGVCMIKTMQCNILMLPMLLVTGGLVIAIALVNVYLLKDSWNNNSWNKNSRNKSEN